MTGRANGIDPRKVSKSHYSPVVPTPIQSESDEEMIDHTNNPTVRWPVNVFRQPPFVDFNSHEEDLSHLKDIQVIIPGPITRAGRITTRKIPIGSKVDGTQTWRRRAEPAEIPSPSNLNQKLAKSMRTQKEGAG